MSLKQQLLTALEQHRDTFLSGQKLADALGVSRNAVWKAICALREEGYQPLTVISSLLMVFVPILLLHIKISKSKYMPMLIQPMMKQKGCWPMG